MRAPGIAASVHHRVREGTGASRRPLRQVRLRTAGAGATVVARTSGVDAADHAPPLSDRRLASGLGWYVRDTHLIIALYRALDRYGSSSVPEDEEDATRSERGRHGPWYQERRRSPGWVSVAEIEACQSPNTYPRLTRRAIRARCQSLATESGSPVRGVEERPGGMRTWVLVAPPGDERGGGPADPDEDAAAAPDERGSAGGYEGARAAPPAWTTRSRVEARDARARAWRDGTWGMFP